MSSRRTTMQALTDFAQLARGLSLDPEALQEAEEFLRFKLNAASLLREEIIRTVQGGVTTFEWVPQSLEPGSRVGPVSQERQDLGQLQRLRLWLDSFLFELVGVGDALAQLVNAAFDLDLSPNQAKLLSAVDAKVRGILRDELMIKGLPEGPDTGLGKWVDPNKHDAGWLKALRELRNQASHRHLVRLAEEKVWERTRPQPGPGKWTSDFRVDLGSGQSEPLINFVVEQEEKVRGLLRETLFRLKSILSLALEHRGGPQAAARRREWWSKGNGPCDHQTVEPAQDEDGPRFDCYFCSACGERVTDIAGRLSPDGSRHL